ncbi:diguanylate cyclase [Novosphingobium sp.]|uniref:diguanylate cyclase domain-containing protein n=1 Tax=Novosphingobium sp. TaxID=1874826 RepID=UPI003342A104
MLSLRELAIQFDPAFPHDLGDTIYTRFKQDPDCPLIAVVDEHAVPIGLIERNAFLTRLAGQYGRAVFGKRPIAPIMEPAPLLVEADTPTGDFAQAALDGHSGQLLKGFIVVDQGRYLGVGVVIDLLKAAVAERVVTEKRLRSLAENLRKSKLEAERQRRFAEAVIEHIPSLVTVRSEKTGKFVLVNKAGAAMFGIDRGRIVGKSVEDVTPGVLAEQLMHADAVLRNLPPASLRDLPFELPQPGKPSADRHRLLRVAQIPVAMPDSDRLILTVAEDVTEASRALSRIEQLAHYDVLTGLPNRAQFQHRLVEVLGRVDLSAEQGGTLQAALLIIDIDRFKSVNDVFGHAVGDVFLREVADRIRRAVRPDDLPSRLGGDEFAVLITGHDVECNDVESMAIAIADRLIDLLSQPYVLADHTVHLGGSIGIALYPRDAHDAERLIHHADVALYRAKADGKGVWRQFSAGMQARQHPRAALESLQARKLAG